MRNRRLVSARTDEPLAAPGHTVHHVAIVAVVVDLVVRRGRLSEKAGGPGPRWSLTAPPPV
jgi:hypothetical protein